MELPRDCWELIFSFLDHHRRLEPLSLTCKQFLSISDGLRSSISLPNPSAPFVPSLFSRFRNLSSIDLSSFVGCPGQVLLQISLSCPNLRRLDVSNQRRLPAHGLAEIASRIKGLKALVLSGLHHLRDHDLSVIASLFPLLEELDISFPQQQQLNQISDEGVSALARTLKSIRKIDLSGNNFLSDQSLVHLSTQCALLREVAARDCAFLTPKGLDFLIRNSPNLVTLSVNISLCLNLANDNEWIHTFSRARTLSSLDVSGSCLSNCLLSSVAEANLPLRTVNMSRSSGFKYNEMLLLLSNNRSIESLDLEGASFLSDQHMSELCKFLVKLTFINLSSCSKVGNPTFYNLVRNCPLLREIGMERTGLGNADSVGTDTEIIKSQVMSLHLGRNNNMCDKWCIKVLARACPRLQFLDANHCPEITQLGVSALLEKCPELMHLDISHCNGVRDLTVRFDVPRLEVLRAAGMGLHNQKLATVARRCSRLLVLDLEGCMQLSDEGVKEAVSHCRTLREINLRWCNGVSVDIIPWLVFSRPSLRKITPPDGPKLSENQRNLFLRHGCLIVNDK